MHRKRTGGSEKGKVIVRSAEPFDEQGVKDIVGNARDNAEIRKCRQGGRKTFLDGFYCRRVFLGNEVVDCAPLRDMN